MTGEPTNVVTFAPRARVVPAQEAPALRSVELRLLENCDLEMTLCDADGNVAAVLALGITARQPADFDLGLLRAAWAEWRGASSVAS